MKGLKFSLMVLTATMLALGLSGMAYAFHSGGVGECGGCHSMHSPGFNGDKTGDFLLVGLDQSSACLTCHQSSTDTAASSYHVSTAPGSLGTGQAPLQRSPGGDFGWLKKTYSFTVRGTTTTEDGETHGHNIVAGNFGYIADATATAPGGTFSSSQLSCVSCHDPHGKYRRLNDNSIATSGAPIIASGSYATSSTPGYAEPPATGTALGVYRLLAGSGYSKAPFPGVPQAKAPTTYNRSEASQQIRVAYGSLETGNHSTWGNWCGTCHGDMHSAGNYVHPVDTALGDTIKGIYDNYVKSGDMTGTNATAFTSLVPFAESASTSYATLATHAKSDNTYLNGPATTDQVMCLSCHRAHASGWEYALRWNIEGEFMVYNSLYPGVENGAPVQFARGRSSAETQAAYYDRPVTTFASYQRVLCNKCHAKD